MLEAFFGEVAAERLVNESVKADPDEGSGGIFDFVHAEKVVDFALIAERQSRSGGQILADMRALAEKVV
jgi:hypothetical protein